jgi:hypothetical protein
MVNCLAFRNTLLRSIQWKPLNMITLGPRESDNISLMITISNLLLIKAPNSDLMVTKVLVNLR